MSEVQYTHQAVRDYVAAMECGDQTTAERIGREIVARHEPGSSELSEYSWANAATPLGGQ
ncbi:hypothetical protein OOK29_09710 [Streptomyces phaeochromogenes]|uniref:hypothetical protein n=1 Tax=Streptomyces phaeochromogenes TaxID=1923 RepID=UPI00224F2915|nr:hypothetical protein [Streptomyces phaeochromogenes]MCX5598413.1 hypothetical protein [Streptomyces phaeochromogenes]